LFAELKAFGSGCALWFSLLIGEKLCLLSDFGLVASLLGVVACFSGGFSSSLSRELFRIVWLFSSGLAAESEFEAVFFSGKVLIIRLSLFI